MKVLVVGSADRFAELCRFFSNKEHVSLSHFEHCPALPNMERADIIIDTNFDEQPDNFRIYALLKDKTVILHALRFRLASFISSTEQLNARIAGANFLPGFMDRTVWELSSLYTKDREAIADDLQKISVSHRWCDDRVGLVSARILAMIINEACYTLQEGTASISDIDTGMKLGTNYPYGPFEWCDRIGIKNIYELLEAIGKDTADDRYRICPLLKSKYLLNENFIS